MTWTTAPTFSITIDNRHHISAAYSNETAAKVVDEIWRRLSIQLVSGSWNVCKKPWGVKLRAPEGGFLVRRSLSETIEAAVAAAAQRPVVLGPHRIVVGLTVDRGDVVQGEPSIDLNVSQYRVDMCAAAAAYELLETGKLCFAEQPIASSAQGAAPLYFECLARLVHRDGSVLPPSDYIESLERLGLVRAFDREVVREVVRQLRTRKKVVLGCNISALSAVRDIWWNSTFAALARAPDISGRLVIEITETAAFPDAAEAIAFMSVIKQTGGRIALDDFGTGHGSLTFAHDAKPDIIKVDSSYIRRCDGVEGRRELTHLVTRLRRFASAVVVEGVENASDMSAAIATGAEWFQGYYFAETDTLAPFIEKL